MDGVVGVTQCGLPPHQQMTYRFVVNDNPGTYWYHGNSGLNKIGVQGIAGMLIVEAPEGKDVHDELYSQNTNIFCKIGVMCHNTTTTSSQWGGCILL